MKFNELNKMFEDISNFFPEEVQQLRTEILLESYKCEKIGNDLNECIEYLPIKIIKNLKIIYQIKASKKQDIIREIRKCHNAENISLLFSLFTTEEIKYINTLMNKQDVEEKYLDVLKKICSLGLCFIIKVDNILKFFIPQEIKDVFHNVEPKLNLNEYLVKFEKIIDMCGVIDKYEMYQLFKELYDKQITLNRFYFYACAYSIICDKYYFNVENDCFRNYTVNKLCVKEYLQIQKSIDFKDLKIDSKTVELYGKNRIAVSPVIYDLIDFLREFGLKKDSDNLFMIQMINCMKLQLQFNMEIILDVIKEFLIIKEFTNSEMEILIMHIIRIYHDTRLYKFRGFKSHEIDEFLTDDEINEIQKKYKIELCDRSYLEVKDMYGEEVEKIGVIEKKDENGNIKKSTICRKITYMKNFNIRKNKKFSTYLNFMSVRDLNQLTSAYNANFLEKCISWDYDKQLLIKQIDKRKDKLIEFNLVILSKNQYDFLQYVIKKRSIFTNDSL